MTEPTRPKNIEEVIEILTEAAKKYLKEHPEELERVTTHGLLDEMRKYAGIKKPNTDESSTDSKPSSDDKL